MAMGMGMGNNSSTKAHRSDSKKGGRRPEAAAPLFVVTLKLFVMPMPMAMPPPHPLECTTIGQDSAAYGTC